MTIFPDILLRGWNWNPVVILSLAAAAAIYVWRIGQRGRPACFVAALLLAALTLLSPLDRLATGVFFSAHMAQHIMLLLFIPAFVLLSLPADFPFGTTLASRLESGSAHPANRRPTFGLAGVGWLLGVGSMWFWHVPQFCDAAASSTPIHAVQTGSLLVMGGAFWWPILAPRIADRLMPGYGIVYLFTACLACTALGILLSLTTVEVCPVFRSPAAVPAEWASLRNELSAARDQQIGGLLMWLPMCLVYVAAIVLELARWLAEPAELRTAPSNEPS